MIEAPSDYIFRLQHDDLYYPSNLSIQLRTDLYPTNLHTCPLDVEIEGIFYPSSSDTGNYLSVSYTGAFTGDSIDKPSLITSWSGDITSGNIDPSTLKSFFTGLLVKGGRDKPSIYTEFTGSHVSGYFDKTNTSVTFSGNFVKIDGNKTNIDIELASIAFDKGYYRWNEAFSGEANLDVELYAIYWYSE
jgi:hypothetical protein